MQKKKMDELKGDISRKLYLPSDNIVDNNNKREGQLLCPDVWGVILKGFGWIIISLINILGLFLAPMGHPPRTKTQIHLTFFSTQQMF